MYKMILEEIKGLADEEYKEFHGSLIPGVKTEFFGVRVPKLRTVAKRIIKEEWREFLKEYENSNVYEMIGSLFQRLTTGQYVMWYAGI